MGTENSVLQNRTGQREQADQLKQNTEQLTYAHLFEHSMMRGNIISWYPIQKEQKVLLVSEPCETVEKVLREKSAQVTVIRSGELEKLVEGVSGKKTETQKPEAKFDVIFQIGILDSESRSAEQMWEEQLAQYRILLKENGALLLTVPNRLGLKYFAGCQDEIYAAYFAGPEGYSSNLTKQAFSKKEYEKILQQAGFLQINRYYPYPDYLFPSVIYSEEHLPEQGELNDNIRNFDKDRYVLFDEMRVFNSLLKEGLFEEFANSFFFVCKVNDVSESDGGESNNGTSYNDKVLYSKFSMERDEKFQIRTDIIRKADGNRVVRKYPLTETAQRHIENMLENYYRLQEQAAGTEISFCPAVSCDGAVEFPWVKGEVLQHKLQKLLESGEKEAAEDLIHQYVERMGKLFLAETVDVDLIFPNILVDGDIWNVIDYEWTFTESIPEKWILYRAMFYLAVQLPGYETTEFSRLLELAGITAEEAEQFGNWEVEFQEYLRGNILPIQNIVDLLGNEVISFEGQRDENSREMERRMNLMEKDVKKLFFNLDRVENKDKKAILSGWACAKTKQKAFIPVHITIFDQDGNKVGRAVNRSMRSDVAEVLKADTDFPYFGFDLSWSAGEAKTYTLRLNAGKLQKEIILRAF